MALKNKNVLSVRHHIIGYSLAALVVIFVVVAATSDSSLKNSASLLANVTPGYILWAFLCVSVSYTMAAGMYFLLAPRLKYRPTLLIAVAGAFAGKLLPAGAGGMTLNYMYLRGRGINRPQSASIVATNNLLGVVAHLLLLLAAVVISGSVWPTLAVEVDRTIPLAVVLVALLITFLVVRRRYKSPIKKSTFQLRRLFARYQRQPWRPALTIVCAMMMTILYSFCLYFSVRAVGSEITFVSALSVYTIGAAAAGLIPTPSGIGAVEAGMLAGLIGFNIAAPVALAAVLVHRLISFWLPFGIGAGALVLARRNRII